MKKWICKQCGYTHFGMEAPEHCPQCGVSKSNFYEAGMKRGCSYSLIAVIIMLTVVIFSLCSCSSSLTVDNSTVKAVDLNRYMGTWYEIARFDHRFERNMEQCTATYTLRDNGMIRVMNRGKRNGKWRLTEGKAKTTDQAGVLRVSFFGPFYSDYRVMMLAPDYSYVLVGGSDDDYLWILSRTPQLQESTCTQIVNEAKRRGYQTDNLIWVKQADTN